MNRFVSLVVGLIAGVMILATTEICFAQRNSNCNVQQNNSQTSAAAAIERAQIQQLSQSQFVQTVQARPATSAASSASSGGGGAVFGPSVAALRAAAVPSYYVQNVQSVPVYSGNSGGASAAASTGGAVASSGIPAVPPPNITAEAVPVFIASNGGGGGSRFGGRSKSVSIAKTGPTFAVLPKNRGTKSVSISSVRN